MRTSRRNNASPAHVKYANEVVARRKDFDTGAPDLVDLLSVGTCTLVGIAQAGHAALVAAASLDFVLSP